MEKINLSQLYTVYRKEQDVLNEECRPYVEPSIKTLRKELQTTQDKEILQNFLISHCFSMTFFIKKMQDKEASTQNSSRTIYLPNNFFDRPCADVFVSVKEIFENCFCGGGTIKCTISIGVKDSAINILVTEIS